MGSCVWKRAVYFKIYVSSNTHTHTHTHTHGLLTCRRWKHALFDIVITMLFCFKDTVVINVGERWALLNLRMSGFCRGKLTIL